MKKRNTIGSFLIILFGLAVVFIVLVATARERTKISAIQEEINALEQKADAVNHDNDALKERIAFFDTDHFNEREAKEKLNYKKQGERVVIVKKATDVAGENMVQKEPEVVVQNVVPNYKKWWMEFFK